MTPVATMNQIRMIGCAFIYAVVAALGVRAEGADDFARVMNLGKAYLENRESAKAIETLNEAVKLDPKSASAWRNLARAHLLAGKPDASLEALAKAAGIEAESARTSYLTGLSHIRASRFEAAIPPLVAAVRLDAQTTALRFQLANAFQAAGQQIKAIEQLKETVRLDPQHASAHYKLANYARQADDQAEFQRHNLEFLRLRKLFGDETRATEALESCTYTLPESAPTQAKPERSATVEVRFSDMTDRVFGAQGDRSGVAACVIEVEEDGGCVLFLAGADGTPALLKMSPDGTFQRTPMEPKLTEGTFESCIVGDFQDDVPQGVKYDPKLHARNDVLLLGRNGVRLLKRTGASTFTDVTEPAGLGSVKANAARWVDYEHDGDLDLFVGGPDGVALRQNNGDGRFENVTEKVGIAAAGSVFDVAVGDFDSNIAVDLVAARGTQPTLVFNNQRAGRFAVMPDPPGPWPPAKRVLINDLNNDGHPDSVLVGEREAVILFGHTATRQRIDLSSTVVSRVRFVDYDNDGWLDLLAVGNRLEAVEQGAVRLWRNPGADPGAQEWSDVSQTTGLAAAMLPTVVDVVTADVDLEGDTDLLLVVADGSLRFLRNDGGNANKQLKVRLISSKTNPSGIGTHVEARAKNFWVTRGVGELPIEIGAGKRERLDTVQTLWTNGVIDNAIDVAVGRTPITILEKNVATGSCPFLYAWDGRGYRFVTDILGNSPIGLSLQRDVMLPADPDEYVWIGDADSFPPRDGRYSLQITEEFREILYLDGGKLFAVDHAPDVEVHSTDKLMPSPFPVSELWALASPKPLRRADGDDGIDRTHALREIDGDFAPPGLPLPVPYRGMCHPLTLTFDFGPLDPNRPLVLAMTGWLQYGDASRNIAMSQNSALTIISPTLDAESASQGWVPLDIVVGMPAGKTKTILCDLTGKLPADARRLRLSTTFEIRWDRVALLERRPLPAAQIHEFLPKVAQLRWRGFSELRSRGPGQPTTPDYDQVSEYPPWRTTPQGWCTRYGDVLDLVTARDGRLAMVNAGDALALQFDAAGLPALQPGMVRSFFFYSIGWDKDADHNVVEGDMVDPLPEEGESAHRNSVDAETDWRLQYNTRWVPIDRFDRRN
jgi:Flp pilus assembly protein TadD